MLEYNKGFIMLCNEVTEKECLTRNLFGDNYKKFQDLDEINIGDIGFLLNYDKDELLGIFRACSKAQFDIEKNAWKGKFAAQVRIEFIGQLQRVKDATYILRKAGVGLRPMTSGLQVPTFPVYGKDVIEKVLVHFKEP